MRRLIGTFVIVLVAVGVWGCDEAKEVSAGEFQAMLARGPESMRHTEFVGVKDGRAYLKVSTMSTLNSKKWTDEYFVTDADTLPEDWLKERQGVKQHPGQATADP